MSCTLLYTAFQRAVFDSQDLLHPGWKDEFLRNVDGAYQQIAWRRDNNVWEQCTGGLNCSGCDFLPVCVKADSMKPVVIEREYKQKGAI